MEVTQDLELDNALWRFAGLLWSRPHFQGACLALQAKGWSVSRILCAAWLSHEKRIYNGKDCVDVIQWRTQVTEALRNARLDPSAVDYVNDRRGVSIEDGELIVSSIYDWFEEDFDGSEAGVIRHLSRYARPPLADALARFRSIDDDRYDWSLNDAS